MTDKCKCSTSEVCQVFGCFCECHSKPVWQKEFLERFENILGEEYTDQEFFDFISNVEKRAVKQEKERIIREFPTKKKPLKGLKGLQNITEIEYRAGFNKCLKDNIKIVNR